MTAQDVTSEKEYCSLKRLKDYLLVCSQLFQTLKLTHGILFSPVPLTPAMYSLYHTVTVSWVFAAL